MMKTLHLSILILLAIFGTTAESYAQMAKNDLGDGNVFNMQAKDLGLPSDIIEINGNLITKDPIKIILNDPNGIIRNSVTTFADRNGDFASELKIPSNATAGTWKIVGNSGIYHRELNFTVVGNSATETCYGLNCIDLNSTGITSTHPLTHGTNLTGILSPLKQFKSGILVQDIKCNQNFQLIVKSEGGSPACVKLDVAYDLIKKGWAASESAYPGNNSQFALYADSTIIPGHLPRHSGLKLPISKYAQYSQFINYSGFVGVYNTTLMYRGTQRDYVLEPGNTGTMTFEIKAQASELLDQIHPVPLPKSLNLTNYAVFYHGITSIKELAKYPGTTINGDGFKACFTRPAAGGTCIGGPSDWKNPIEAWVTDHPGVNVLFEPPIEMLQLGPDMTSQKVTMTITVDSDAPKGTYLVELAPSGEFLLTVGNQPYHE